MNGLPQQIDTLRDAIASQLNAANVGVFHKLERYDKRKEALRTHYGEPIAGGFIRMQRYRRTTPYENRHVLKIRWQITYLLAFSDETKSQLAFEQAITELDSKLMADETLGGVAEGLSDGTETGLQLDDAQPVMFCGVLCHQATLHLTTEHYE